MANSQQASPSIPNNLGPTLLIFAGIVTLPALLGIALLLIGLSALKEADGNQCFPRLHGWFRVVQNVQFWRIIKL
jgi:hypothetical protein